VRLVVGIEVAGRRWFDDAMQKMLPALCDGDTTENG
jgi:hypothetical protein